MSPGQNEEHVRTVKQRSILVRLLWLGLPRLLFNMMGMALVDYIEYPSASAPLELARLGIQFGFLSFLIGQLAVLSVITGCCGRSWLSGFIVSVLVSAVVNCSLDVVSALVTQFKNGMRTVERIISRKWSGRRRARRCSGPPRRLAG